MTLKVASDLWDPRAVDRWVCLFSLWALVYLKETHKGSPSDFLSQVFLDLCIQVINTPEILRKPSQPPPRPPPDYLCGGSPPAPLPAHLSRAARNSPGPGSQIERTESSRRPPPSRPIPPAPNCILSQVSGLSAALGWEHCF